MDPGIVGPVGQRRDRLGRLVEQLGDAAVTIIPIGRLCSRAVSTSSMSSSCGSQKLPRW
ncbi:MAG: hypothetical protein JO168_24555 [Solirubrobacterales bacterium]|nr:hypothetical protein [Solirubrobacterales bacterium]